MSLINLTPADPSTMSEKQRKRVAKYHENKAKQLEGEAAKRERRTLKMSRKIGRGNIRARNAAETASGLRQQAAHHRAEAARFAEYSDPA